MRADLKTFEMHRSAWAYALSRSEGSDDLYTRSVARKLLDITECRAAGYETPCWVWTGALTEKGYSKFKVCGLRTYTHRHAYMALIGPIPEGLVIDHLCRNKACCNPLHLETVTPGENSLRLIAAGKKEGWWRQPVPAGRPRGEVTHCVRGHEYSPENTRITRAGHRSCRACDRARGLIKNPAARAAKRAARTAAAVTGDGSPRNVLAAGEPLETVPHRTLV